MISVGWFGIRDLCLFDVEIRARKTADECKTLAGEINKAAVKYSSTTIAIGKSVGHI